MKATKWKSRRPENAELVLFLFRHSWPFVVVCESPSVELWVVRVAVCIYMGSIATLLLLTLPEQSRDNSCVEARNKQLNVERARKAKHWSHVESCEQKHLRCVAPQFGHLGFFRSVYIWQTSSHDLALTMIMFQNLPYPSIPLQSLIFKLCQHIDSSLAGWWARQERWGMKRKHWQPVEAIKNPQSVLRQSKSCPWQRMVGNQKHPSAIKRHPFSAIGPHTHTKTTREKDNFQPPKSPFTKEKFSSIFCKRIPC